MMTYILIIIMALLVIYIFRESYGWGEVLQGLAVIAIPLTLMASCFNSEWYKESKQEQALKEVEDRKPRVIREADGCKVYTFKDGQRWHYYTKCPSTTTTESSYSVSCGKNCSKTEVETIVTENK